MVIPVVSVHVSLGERPQYLSSLSQRPWPCELRSAHGVTLAFGDEQALANDVSRARRMGMGAKLCIHPKQVAGVNQGFAPSATELQWAQRVLQQVEQHGLGAIAVDGKLVDRPVWLLAQSLVNEALPSAALPTGAKVSP